MAQDPRETARLCQILDAASAKGKGKKDGITCKKSSFTIAGTAGIVVDSWRFQEWDYKRSDLPTYARGLFTTKRTDGTPEIVIRGYDKFFNVGEVPDTNWQNIQQRTTGPYELSVKENGCIIFMSGLEDGTLLVCSKHSTGARSDVTQSHAVAGEKWIKRHVEGVGKTTRDLAQTLRAMNATAVGELCDDEFEEHVLEYPPEAAGLYLHGLNFNLPEFSTASGPEVHEFADTWGFKKAQYVIIQSLDEVQHFLDTCAETGSWDGRDTEGFVVRCKKAGPAAGATAIHGPDWFFKYKFEEPYLMYRQWRECTKAIIAGKPPKFKKHKKITEEYLLYARRRLARDASLAKAYAHNHGIIQMRDGFLAEKGQKGSDIIAQERRDEGGAADQAVKVVLVPIATIGCGKTTVAAALVSLFGFGHVQNDNIKGPKNRPSRFADAVTSALAVHDVVIADRNNHQRRERQQIIDDVEKVLPEVRFVAYHYVHEPKDRMLDGIRQVTRRRVLDRGDNHQTIRAGSKSPEEIISIMEGFLYRFEACDPITDPDSGFDEVIDLDVAASSLENLETVITHLYNAYPHLLPDQMPGAEEMHGAIEAALSNEVTTKHDLSFGKGGHRDKPGAHHGGVPSREAGKMAPTPDQLLAKIEYFCITLSAGTINSILEKTFEQADPHDAHMYRILKQSRRLQSEFHVTLIHRASATAHPDTWRKYSDLFENAVRHSDLRDPSQWPPSLGPARVKLERVVWDDRVMAIVVRIFPTKGHAWDGANAIHHITIGTAGAEIKPVESNAMLALWESGNEHAGIRDKEVPGAVVLEGSVKTVFQRGAFK